MPHEITRFPPVLQLVLLALLAAYVLVSVLARVPGYRWLWRDRGESRGVSHLLSYTIVPALMLAVAAVAVYRSWDPAAPLDGGWSVRELTLGPGMALLGLVTVVAGQVAGRATELGDAARPAAWVPLVTILVGIALLAVGVTSLGRTVKRASASSARSDSFARSFSR